MRAMTLPAVTLAIVMAVYAVRMLRDNLIGCWIPTMCAWRS
jgi:ABC-type dipeptide/oligopeptide/nickel transport system permease component